MASGSGAEAKKKRSDEISRSRSTDTKGRNTASDKTAGQEDGGKRIEIIVSSSPSDTRRVKSECNIMQF